MKYAFLKRISAVLPLFLCLLCTGCSVKKPVTLTKTVFAMDTVMTLTASGDRAQEALSRAEEEIFRLDALLNRHVSTSAVSLLNREGIIENEELASLLLRTIRAGEETGFAFDCTLAPLLDIWDISGKGRIPAPEEIKAALAVSGAGKYVLIDGSRITLSPGTKLDLGGVGKGYAGERIRSVYEEYGVTGSFSLGGDNCLIGPKDAKTPFWRVGLRDPGQEDGILGILSVTDTFTVTSGSYERFFTGENGTVYHHIFDPGTGFPAKSGLVSVTVLTEDGVRADALATAFFVMGEEQTKLWLRTHPEISAILVTEDNRVLYSTVLSEAFLPQNSGYTFETF